jgi:hypothetical protein
MKYYCFNILLGAMNYLCCQKYHFKLYSFINFSSAHDRLEIVVD